MATTLTLKLDDETNEALRTFEQNLQASAESVDHLSETGRQLEQVILQTAEANAELARSEAQTVEQTRNLNVSFGQASEEGKSLLFTLVEMAGKAFLLRQAIAVVGTAGSASAKALGLLGLGMTRVVSPIAAVTLAAKGAAAVLDNTGERVELVAGSLGNLQSTSERLAREINSGFKSIDQVTAETGKSLEQLGLKGGSNLDRISDAAGRLGSDFLVPVEAASQAVKDWWNETNILADAWEAFDKDIMMRSSNIVTNLGLIGEGFLNLTGFADEGQRAAHARLDEIEARTGPIRERLKLLDQQIAKEQEVAEKLREIQRTSTEAELNEIQAAARQRREAFIHSLPSDEELAAFEQGFGQFLRTIENRRVQLREEAARKETEITQRNIEFQQKFYQEQAEERSAQIQREIAEHNAKVDKIIEAEKHQADSIRRIQLDARNEFLDIVADQLDEDESMRNAALRLRKQIIENELQAELDAADTKIEKQEAVFRAQQRLNALMFSETRRRIAEEQKAEADAAAKKKAAMDAEVGRLQQPSQQMLERVRGSFSQRDVLNQIIQQRTQSDERLQQPGLSARGRRRIEQNIRREAQRDARTGGIDSSEVSQAQNNLTRQVIGNAAKSGKLNRAQVQALIEAQRAMETQARQTEQLQQELEVLKNAFNATRQGLENSGRETRARRRSGRP